MYEPDEITKRLSLILRLFKGKKEELIPILQKVQEEFGYIPSECMLDIGRFIKVPESKVYGTATFYTQFRFNPKGRTQIMVCRGTACHVKRSLQILESIERVLTSMRMKLHPMENTHLKRLHVSAVVVLPHASWSTRKSKRE